MRKTRGREDKWPSIRVKLDISDIALERQTFTSNVEQSKRVWIVICLSTLTFGRAMY